MVLPLDSFVLKRWAAAAADLTLGAYQAIYPLSLFSASWEHHVSYGSVLLFKVYDIAVNMMKTMRELQTCTAVKLTRETAAHMMMPLTWSFRQILGALVLSALATGGARKCVQSYRLYCIFTFVYISVNWEWCYTSSVCVSTFWYILT